MSQEEIQREWSQVEDHVERMLLQVQEGPQILKFVEAMCDYFKQRNCSSQVINELNVRVKLRGFHYAMKLKSEEMQDLKEYVKLVFDPETEACLIAPKAQITRVEDAIRNKNCYLKDESDRVKSTTKGKIRYRIAGR